MIKVYVIEICKLLKICKCHLKCVQTVPLLDID